MYPSASHPQNHHPSSTSIMHHHQPRQSKLLNTQQAPSPPSRIRTHNNTTVGINTPTCANCATQTTPLWRRNQSGETLCNACALFQKMKGRPRPISLKTNVIKPRNRIKAIDRIPLEPSSSHNHQHGLVAARSNSSLANFNHQQAVLVHANKKNQNYPPNPRNIKSPATATPTNTSLFPPSFHSNPIASHLCSSALSSPNQFHSPTSKPHFLDPHRLSPSPNHHINPSSSQSPASSQNSFCSTRSVSQVQSDPTQLARSGITSRKSSPGGVDARNNQDANTTSSFPHEAKRRKFLSDDLLSKTNLYERRISTGSIEPLHRRHHSHLPLRASSHARIPPASSVCHELSDLRTSPSNEFSRDVYSSSQSHEYYASVDDNLQHRPPQLVPALSSGQRTPASIDCGPAAEEKSLSRGRSTFRPSRCTLPPLSQITKDLPKFQLKSNPINFGPPLSFETSAREARLNSPNSSQHLLTIPSSTHTKKFEKRRATSVISSVSDSESALSPAHTASTGSRIYSPLDRSHFSGNTGSPITPPVNGEGVICKSHDDCKTYFNHYRTETENQNTNLPKLMPSDSTYPSSEENEPQSEELNRLKSRIVQLELINGVMETRINQLENTHSDRLSLSEASDDDEADQEDQL